MDGIDTGRFPVERISWHHAVEFCNALSGKENLPPYYRLDEIERKNGWITKATAVVLGGKGYRLPTEAEWEYACRAGTTTRFAFGDASNGTESNINGNEPLGTTDKGPHLNRPTTVASYAPNAFGLCDMHGNVWEWCEDWYVRDEYARYATGTAFDPVGPDASQKYRVMRGGCWYWNAVPERSAHRAGKTVDGWQNDIQYFPKTWKCYWGTQGSSCK